MKRSSLFYLSILCLLLAACFAGCGRGTAPGELENTVASTATPESTQTPTQEPTPTPEPTPTVITIGAVGDIMMMQSQVNGAYVEETDTYDFSRSFVGVYDMFNSVDLMCGNLETAIAGEDAGYSKKKTDSETVDTFNAPDELIDDLKKVGFDFLSTANNHALDRQMPGLLHTLDVLDEKGVYHTGTARSNEERDTPLVIDVQGIKIGIVAATDIINKHDRWMTDEEAEYAINRLYLQQERLLAEVQACRDAGADLIIAYPHWDKEHRTSSNEKTRACAKLLLESGVDVILGSHPHVVQSIEFMTVERDDGPYTGLVVYSMGNFISNMAGKSTVDPLKYGLYVQLTIEKDTAGNVTLKDASFMPLYCFYKSIDGQYVHQVIPALSDPNRIRAFSELSERDLNQVELAREFVIDTCTTDAIPVMDDASWVY